MPRRGGRHQQSAAGAALPAAAVAEPMRLDDCSPLGRVLLEKWAWGILSAPLVQEITNAAKLSGALAPDIVWMAALGSYGRLEGNINKGLVRQYCKHLIPPEPHSIQVPFKVRRGTTTVVSRLPCELLLPHDWFAALEAAGAAESVFGLDQLAQFWQDHDPQDPKLVDNVVLRAGPQRVVPFVLHGDGARFQTRDSLMIVSMRSLLASGTIKDTQLLLAAIPKRCRVKGPAGNTWDCIWKTLAWSFTALSQGLHPCVDPGGLPFPVGSRRALLAGAPLATSGRRGLVYAFIADMEFHAVELGLAHASSTTPCFK